MDIFLLSSRIFCIWNNRCFRAAMRLPSVSSGKLGGDLTPALSHTGDFTAAFLPCVCFCSDDLRFGSLIVAGGLTGDPDWFLGQSSVLLVTLTSFPHVGLLARRFPALGSESGLGGGCRIFPSCLRRVSLSFRPTDLVFDRGSSFT